MDASGDVMKIDLVEAYLCCVVQAKDPEGLALGLGGSGELYTARPIVESLKKNLETYGYKIVEVDDRSMD